MSGAGSGPAVSAAEINAFVAEHFAAIGNECIEVGSRSAVTRFDASTTALRPGGILSGPTVFTACDAALWYALFGAVGIEAMALTSELSIRFLRPARGEEMFARAELHHVGRRSVIGTVQVWTDDPDRPVAVAQGTYVRPAT
jgi:uncharacterized protein (TIGR00369 family)